MNTTRDIIIAYRKNTFFNRSKCFFKTIKNNFGRMPISVIHIEHDYEEVAINKVTSKKLLENAIRIGNGDYICKQCGKIKHDFVEHPSLKGYFYCKNEYCPETKVGSFAQLVLDFVTILAKLKKLLKI